MIKATHHKNTATLHSTINTQQIWKNNLLIHVLRGHEAPILSISQPWNGRIWTGDENGVICLWQISVFCLLRKIKFASHPITHFMAICNEFMFVATNDNVDGVLIAALTKEGNVSNFLLNALLLVSKKK